MSDDDAARPTDLHGLDPAELFARGMQSVRMSTGGSGRHGWTPPSLAETARLFPHYEMLRMLGAGGMGAVFEARQTALDRLVAIKLLPLEVSVDRTFVDRFVREARAMAKLNHPHIVTVYDFGQTGEGHLFFVMEHVAGANLHQIIHKEGLAADQALAIVGEVCTALAYAHGRGVVHRDIKPANVLLDAEGHVKVADFGLARLTDPGAERGGSTMTGTIMGTPDYMAPEQKRGVPVDHRADIYALGVMLYEMLCREVPQGVFAPPSQRIGCDARIDQIVLRAMQQQPELRFQSTTEMKAAVDTARTPLPAAPVEPSEPVNAGPPRVVVHRPAPKIAPTPLPFAPPARKRRRIKLWIVLVLLALLVTALAYFLAHPPKWWSAVLAPLFH